MQVHNQNQIFKQYISRLQTDFILVDHGLCPDWSRGPHRRRRDSIYFILDGKGEININGNIIHPKNNDLVLLPKNSIVSLYSENDSCYNKYWCEFMMHHDGVSVFEKIKFPYLVSLTDGARAIELFEILDEMHLRNDAASALKINAALYELVSMFLENEPGTFTGESRNSGFAEDMKTFIQKNIASPLSNRLLADHAGFNEKYFIDIFKKSFGTTPAQYIRQLRLETAKYELLYTQSKAEYIINKIGYSSVQKLSKDFKAYTGMTPSEFRKRFK